MENIRRKKRLDIVTSYQNCEREQPNFSFRWPKKLETNIGDQFSLFRFDKREITFDKPNYLGCISLGLLKLHMYELYYTFLHPFYGQDNLRLHLMDKGFLLLFVHQKHVQCVI